MRTNCFLQSSLSAERQDGSRIYQHQKIGKKEQNAKAPNCLPGLHVGRSSYTPRAAHARASRRSSIGLHRPMFPLSIRGPWQPTASPLVRAGEARSQIPQHSLAPQGKLAKLNRKTLNHKPVPRVDAQDQALVRGQERHFPQRFFSPPGRQLSGSCLSPQGAEEKTCPSFYFFLFCLGPHLQHVEVSRLGVK